MKFEKISENQIRCTLDKNDLTERQLKLSELAYGSDKANALFRDMLQKASAECNFETEDLPLMIEAIPLSSESLVLLITKVSDPDELDTRFSNFTAPPEDSSDTPDEFGEKAYADEILHCFDQFSKIVGDKLMGSSSPAENGIPVSDNPLDEVASSISAFKNLCKVYSFATFEEVIVLAKRINRFYHGENTLLKDPVGLRYYLIVNLSEHTAKDFNKVCNIITEYGKTEHVTPTGFAYFEEHFEVVVKNKATQVLSKL